MAYNNATPRDYRGPAIAGLGAALSAVTAALYLSMQSHIKHNTDTLDKVILLSTGNAIRSEDNAREIDLLRQRLVGALGAVP